MIYPRFENYPEVNMRKRLKIWLARLLHIVGLA